MPEASQRASSAALQQIPPLEPSFSEAAALWFVPQHMRSNLIDVQWDSQAALLRCRVERPERAVASDTMMAHALALVCGSAVELRFEPDGAISAAPRYLTQVRLPSSQAMLESVETYGEPLDRALLVAAIEQYLIDNQPQLPSRAPESMVRSCIAQFPQLHAEWREAVGTTAVHVHNKISALFEPWFHALVQRLDDTCSGSVPRKPEVLQFEHSTRERYTFLLEAAAELGCGDLAPLSFSDDIHRRTVRVGVSLPSDTHELLQELFRATTDYDIQIDGVPSWALRQQELVRYIVRPLDPWFALSRPVSEDQVQTVRGVLPEVLDVRAVRATQEACEVTYARAHVPREVFDHLTPQLERIGCPIVFREERVASYAPLTPAMIEEVVRSCIAPSNFVREIHVGGPSVRVSILCTDQLNDLTADQELRLTQFIAPRKLDWQCVKVDPQFRQALHEMAPAVARALIPRSNAQGVITKAITAPELLSDLNASTTFRSIAVRIPRSERADLTSIPTIAIDEPNTRIREDALSVTRTAAGWQVWVHVVDLASWCAPGSQLEQIARERILQDNTSSSWRIPVFPKQFLVDEISLDPQTERAAFSVRFDVASDGTIEHEELFASVVRNDQALTYAEATGSLRSGKASETLRFLSDASHAVRQADVTRRAAFFTDASHSLVGAWLSFADEVVTNTFRRAGLEGLAMDGGYNVKDRNNFVVGNHGTVSIRRAGKEYPSLVNQQQLYSLIFDLPPVARQDLEAIADDATVVCKQIQDENDWTDTLDRLVRLGRWIGSTVEGVYVPRADGVAAHFRQRGGFQTEAVTFAAGLTPPRSTTPARARVDGVQCADGKPRVHIARLDPSK